MGLRFSQNKPQKAFLILQIIAGILLFICAIIDIVLQTSYGFVNPLSMGDDIAILIIATIFLISSCRKKRANNPFFRFFVGFVWFVGFGCKGFAMQFINNHNSSVSLKYFLLTGLRTFLLFFCIPLVCIPDCN